MGKIGMKNLLQLLLKVKLHCAARSMTLPATAIFVAVRKFILACSEFLFKEARTKALFGC